MMQKYEGAWRRQISPRVAFVLVSCYVFILGGVVGWILAVGLRHLGGCK